MIDICLLGTGGMMPLPGRHLTSMILRYKGHSILVDCGEGTQVAIRKYAWSMYSIDMICFTHLHGDHVAGISGLLSSMTSEGRTEPVTIIGPKRIAEVVSKLCVVVGVSFEVKFHEIDSGRPIPFYDMTIRPFKVNHNILCYGYRFDLTRRPKFLPEKAEELGIPRPLWSKLQQGEQVFHGCRRIDPEEVTGPQRKGLSFVYSTDTRPCENLEKAARDVDLLIVEGIYGDEDKLGSAKEKKHMTSREAAELSKRAGAKEVWLTHYSPSFQNQADYRDEIRAIYARVEFAYDGKSKTLSFPEP